MSKTHTKINQLEGDKLKGFAYANNTDKELVDDILATRDETNGYTEIAREYNSIAPNIAFTGTGNNDFSVNSIVTQRPYTFTIDSQDNYSGLQFSGFGLNDAVVNHAGYTGVRPMFYQFAIDANNDELSTGSGGFTGTPINGETFNDGFGNSFKFISYDIGTDTIYAYSVVGNIIGTYTGINSGATVTLLNPFSAGTNEVGTWSDNQGNNGVWSIVPTVPYAIGTGLNTLDVTYPLGVHTVGDSWTLIFAKGSLSYELFSPSGTFTVGETITQAVSGATATVALDNGDLFLINIVGQLDLGASSGLITGSISGQTAILNSIQSVNDTFTWTDGTTTENQVLITTSLQVLDSGNIDIHFISSTGHNVGDQWQLTFQTTVVTTGFESNQVQFPNVPFQLDASAMVATDGIDKMAVGVLDLTPFGQSKLVAGILALYDDGSQSTFTTQKGYANLSLFDISTNKNLNVNYSGDEFRVQGFDGSNGYELLINPTRFRYDINGQQQSLPTTQGTSNQIMRTDGIGNMFWDNEVSTGNAINGLKKVGSDILMGGNLTEDTDIANNNFYWRVSGFDNALNNTGICYYPSGFNGLSGYAGAYSNVVGYNKAGVYTTGLNTHLAVLGFYDGSGLIENASFTIHEHDMNTAVSRKNTRLAESASAQSLYSDTIDVDGINIKHTENYQNSSLTSPANGFLVSRDVDLSTPSQVQLIESRDTLNNISIVEANNITANVQKIFTVSDGLNTQTFRIKSLDMESSSYQNTRDDSGTTTPINLIYTDSNGKFQSAPLGKGTYNLLAYADDIAAGVAGLISGTLYQTDGTAAAPLNVAGIVMIKQ